MTKFRCLLAGMVLTLVGMGIRPAEGQVVLKPNGQNAVPLHLKALQADATIDRQFATTHSTMSFQNETEERIEADFIYTLPPGAIVTYFAYWYGDEKVVARIVEKEEAAAIYAHITARMHDPALVEMIGKNTFRARIFPVMPNSDLKVEMTIMQALPSDRQGCFYTFPLRAEAGGTLSSLRFQVHVQPDPSLVRVTDNYGLAMPLRHDGYDFLLTGTNYHPPHDLRINLARSRQPLQAALYAAPSGGRDGFFALALTPDHPLRRPRVDIYGVTTYQVVPARLSDVRAYSALTLFGRYRGSGPATVTLTGESPTGRWSHTANVVFGAEHRPQNVASKLWAARRIEQLGTRRDAVIALSKQFCLPSRFTSWLAVPKEEMERYRFEKAQAQIEVVARRLATEIRQGRDHGRLARQLRTRLNDLCRQAGEDPKEALSQQFEAEVATVTQSLAEAIQRGGMHSKQARQLRTRLDRLCRAAGENSRLRLSDVLQNQANELVDELDGEQNSPRPNTAQEALLHTELVRLARAMGVSAQSYIEQRRQWRNDAYASRYRTGDPLIQVEAPADARQVVAILPGGEIKPLIWDAARGRWEARFDIPAYTRQGRYVITILIMLKDGVRQMLTLTYFVDLTPPQGTGQMQAITTPRPTLRLEMNASEDTTRVVALLPWGDKVALQPAAQPHRFFGLAPLPAGWQNRTPVVTFVLTDRAHNRTRVTVDPTEP